MCVHLPINYAPPIKTTGRENIRVAKHFSDPSAGGIPLKIHLVCISNTYHNFWSNYLSNCLIYWSISCLPVSVGHCSDSTFSSNIITIVYKESKYNKKIETDPFKSIGGLPVAFLLVLGLPFSSLNHAYRLSENPCTKVT